MPQPDADKARTVHRTLALAAVLVASFAALIATIMNVADAASGPDGVHPDEEADGSIRQRVVWTQLDSLPPERLAELIPLATCELLIADREAVRNAHQLTKAIAAHRDEPLVRGMVVYVVNGAALADDREAASALLSVATEGFGVHALSLLITRYRGSLKEPRGGGVLEHIDYAAAVGRLMPEAPTYSTRVVGLLLQPSTGCEYAVARGGAFAQRAIVDLAKGEAGDAAVFQRNVVTVYELTLEEDLSVLQESAALIARIMRTAQEWETRGWAIYKLGGIPDPQVREAVEWAAQNDPNPDVRRTASEKLEELKTLPEGQ